MTREQRKLDHIRYAMESGDGNRRTGLEDIRFLHNCLTPVDPDKVDISTRIGSLKLPVPVFMDAITGGAPEVKEINRRLAAVARDAGAAMAVGSQCERREARGHLQGDPEGESGGHLFCQCERPCISG